MQTKLKTLQKIIIVIGPTASGKSDYAVDLASKINGEIISADSRQVYKNLNIGSGKITQEEMKTVMHHGLDIVQPEDKFTSVDFMLYAQKRIEDIISRNRIPIICGGTGMYIDALLYGIENNPGPDYELRHKLKYKNLGELQNILKKKNEIYFMSLNNSEKNNPARLIRKIELENFENKKDRELLYDAEIHILSPSRELIKSKIEKRLDKRMENDAMITEIKNLINYKNNITQEEKQNRIDWLLSLGLEYKYVAKYLIGRITFEEMQDTLKLKIYQYAKRQITWNKRYLTLPNIKIINIEK